ncbi:MAG: hypothetical protein CK425_01290 [Parachlamydia sp.]|nr:MAG: hypothetical protein CK425_01290 [Parachlamydia sp.]
MKSLLALLASFMAVSGLSAAPNMNNCSCQNCTCTQEKHCGCLAKAECEENRQCKYSCTCEDDCRCK